MDDNHRKLYLVNGSTKKLMKGTGALKVSRQQVVFTLCEFLLETPRSLGNEH